MVNTARLNYIDVEKGILILIVCFCHIEQNAMRVGISDSTIHELLKLNFLWLPFFMQAFFVVTGYVGSFNKPLKKHLDGNLKTLLLPAILFFLIQNFLKHLLAGQWHLSEIIEWQMLLKDGGFLWFLVAMFETKIFYWFVFKIKNNIFRRLVVLVLFLCGFLLHNYGVYNYWYIQNGLMMVLSLEFGYYLRGVYRPGNETEHSGCVGEIIPLKNALIAAIIYFSIILILPLCRISVPNLTMLPKVEWITVIPLIVICITAPYFLMYLSQKIGKNLLMEKLGAASLVIYSFHAPIQHYLFAGLKCVFMKNVVFSSIGVVIIFALTVLLAYLIYMFINTKYLKFMIGKF